MRAARTVRSLRWRSSRVFKPVKEDTPSKAVADARWALASKMVEGEMDVKARSAAEGYEDPDPKNGLVGTLGRASFRASNLQVLPSGALKK